MACWLRTGPTASPRDPGVSTVTADRYFDLVVQFQKKTESCWRSFSQVLRIGHNKAKALAKDGPVRFVSGACTTRKAEVAESEASEKILVDLLL